MSSINYTNKEKDEELSRHRTKRQRKLWSSCALKQACYEMTKAIL